MGEAEGGLSQALRLLWGGQGGAARSGHCLKRSFVFSFPVQVIVLLFSSLRQPVFALQPAVLNANVAQIRGDHNEACWVVVSLLDALCLSARACLEKSEQRPRCLENPRAVIGVSPNK